MFSTLLLLGGFNYNVTCGLRPLQARARRDVSQLDELEEESDEINPLYRRKGRIVGGSTASYGMVPWMVSIRLKYSSDARDHTHHCGGILIGEYWVMSAAHCFRLVHLIIWCFTPLSIYFQLYHVGKLPVLPVHLT